MTRFIALVIAIISLLLSIFINFKLLSFEKDLASMQDLISEKEISLYNLINTKERNLYSEILKLKNETSTLQNYLKNILSDYNKLKSKIEEIESRIKNVENRLYSSNYIVLNPPLEEVKKFLEEDDTDKIPYNDETFICTDYANRFVKNFLDRGYYSCVSYLYFEDSAHAIVAINTSDYGLIYVEPQQDKIIFKLEKGMNYCDAIGLDCKYTIKRIIDCFNYGS